MSAFADFYYLEHGFPLEVAERRIEAWSQRGLAFYSDIETRSSHLQRLCRVCGGNVREMPLGVECVRCGADEIRPDTEGL